MRSLFILLLLVSVTLCTRHVALHSRSIPVLYHNNHKLLLKNERFRRAIHDESEKNIYLVMFKRDVPSLNLVEESLQCTLKFIDKDAYLCYSSIELLQQANYLEWYTPLPDQDRIQRIVSMKMASIDGFEDHLVINLASSMSDIQLKQFQTRDEQAEIRFVVEMEKSLAELGINVVIKPYSNTTL